MIRIGISTDQHWSQNSSILRKQGKKYSVRLENLIKSVNWFEQLTEIEHCDMNFYLGDFFDRSDLNAQEITALSEIKWFNNKKYFLVGNHESNVLNLNFSSTKVFEKLDSKIISEPMKLEANSLVDMYFLPYMSSNNKVLKLTDYIPKDTKKKIILSHNDIAGLQYGKFISTSGFLVNDIMNDCTLFINGHLHNSRIINDKIVLVGNLTGQNFNEDSTKYEHLAYIMQIDDDGKITLEPYINPYAFNFYKIYINSLNDLNKLNNLKSNSVLSLVCNGNLVQRTKDLVRNNKNVVEYRVISVYQRETSEEDGTEEFIKTEDHITQFINYVQTKLEPSKILSEELSILYNL